MLHKYLLYIPYELRVHYKFSQRICLFFYEVGRWFISHMPNVYSSSTYPPEHIDFSIILFIKAHTCFGTCGIINIICRRIIHNSNIFGAHNNRIFVSITTNAASHEINSDRDSENQPFCINCVLIMFASNWRRISQRRRQKWNQHEKMSERVYLRDL